VLIVDPQSGDPESDAAEIDRIVTQHVENTHRAGLTPSDEVGVARQLTAFGLTPNQIARRTRTKKARVEQAVAIAESELAAKATGRYDLTLDQAAVVAEFDDQPEVVKTLVAAARAGQFDHVAQRARDDRAELAVYDQAVQELSEQQVPVVGRPEWDDPKVKDLVHLRDGDGNQISAETHAACPGRAAYIDVGRDWDTEELEAEISEVCVDYKAHGHTSGFDTYRSTSSGKKPAAEMSDDERERAREQRRLVIAHNKAWASASDVRRAWIRDFVTRKTPPKGTAPFVAAMLARDPELLVSLGGNHLAAELLGEHAGTYGRSDALDRLIEQADDKRAQVLTLALVLAACEAHVLKDTWRGDGCHSWHGRYLRFLADHGYTLSEVEEYAASDQTV
jgi:ParB family chromosome partitioning protein